MGSLSAPISALPLDLDLTWECSNSSAYTFTGPGLDNTEKSPYHYANVVAHQVVTIPAGSPFASKLMWKGSCAPGQLTPMGALQHRKLGAALRQIYVDKLNFLPETYDPTTVHIRSTGNGVVYIPLNQGQTHVLFCFDLIW